MRVSEPDNAARTEPDRTPPGGRLGRARAYVAIARPDHWFKNGFMLLGVVLAYFYQLNPSGPGVRLPVGIVLGALAAVCLVASSNYVINEILDAPTDRHHPRKRLRPIASGRVPRAAAYVEWLVLAAAGLGTAWLLGRPMFTAALALWLMGVIYNVPPLRSKDHAYVDVLTESINNPLRLLLGWFAVMPREVPPLSLVIAYWMIGAFFMAGKRLAEYRWLGADGAAGAYRASFRRYDENSLLVSMFVYATASALLLGVFIIRYHLELILSLPLVAGFFGYYLHVTLKHDSPAQSPERLYRERGLMIYLSLCLAVFVLLMFVHVPALYRLLNVPPPQAPPLWRV